MPETNAPSERHCSFCGKSQREVTRLIDGGNAKICEDCVNLCIGIIEEQVKNSARQKKTIPTPQEIFDHLNQYVIGQDDAKVTLSVALREHYKRLLPENKVQDDVEMEKSNILLIGPSGSGKTHIVKTLARLLDVPYTIEDATSMTQSGYVGMDVEEVLLHLWNAAGHDIERAQKGIVYIDEIDKISSRRGSENFTRDPSGEGVQQALLKLIEGSKVTLPARLASPHTTGQETPNITIDTSNILFIVGGAFSGLENIIEKRLSKKGVGFNAPVEKQKSESERLELVAQVTVDDLRKYGLITEFVGRIPVFATLSELTEQELVRVLTEPKNAITKQFVKSFQLDGVELVWEDDAIKAVAELAKERRVGARGLRSIIEKSLTKAKFHMLEKVAEGHTKAVVTRAAIVDGTDLDWGKAKKKKEVPAEASA